jgi:hypothetical protein
MERGSSVLCTAVHSGVEAAILHIGQVVHGLEDICVRSSGFSLHFPPQSTTSFSLSHTMRNPLKIRSASQQPNWTGERAIISNGCAAHGHTSSRFLPPPCRGRLTLVEFSLPTSLARPAARLSTACGLAVLVPWQSQTCVPPAAASRSRR